MIAYIFENVSSDLSVIIFPFFFCGFALFAPFFASECLASHRVWGDFVGPFDLHLMRMNFHFIKFSLGNVCLFGYEEESCVQWC